METNITSLILAAGKGTRMNSDLPKVMHPILGKPMVSHVVDLSVRLGIPRTIVVVGHRAELVRDVLPEGVENALQAEQRGTGHAVMCAAPALKDSEGDLLVLYGDMPLLRDKTIKDLIAVHRDNGYAATVLTAELDDPSAYGRIIRAADGGVEAIVEFKDATDEQKGIKEINTGIYVFQLKPLMDILHEIKSDNNQNEYYLTDAIHLLNKSGHKVGAMIVEDANEGVGVNNPEELAACEDEIRRRMSE